jgi:NAD(P)-dependent dehydrogenase (short-subunit alcohol dehydrogenase family)
MAPLPCPTKEWHSTSYQAISPSRPELSVKGKVILVTGGGAGIGASITRSFAEAGASHIAILGRRQAVLEATASEIGTAFPATKIHTYSADITDRDAIFKAFQDYSSAVGKIDILVSNAASGETSLPIKDAEVSKWFGEVETNIKGPLHLIQAFLSGPGKPDGQIINITSGLSFIWGPGMSAYAVSKEAGVRLFEIAGMENPELRIVNVQPGIVPTDMNRRGTIPAQDDSECTRIFGNWFR